MTLTELRNMVLWRTRSVLPEVTDWNTLLRFMRTAGQPALQEWEIDYDQDMFEDYARQALARYGEITRVFRYEIELVWSDEATDLDYREIKVIEPLVVYWRPNETSDYHLVRKVFQPPLRRKAQLERGRPRIWWLMGQRLYLNPVPNPNELLLIEAVMEPYWIEETQEIIGVDPTDIPMIAQWIASFYIEWQNVQLALAWRTEAEQFFLRRRMNQAWYEHRNRRGVRWHRR